MHTHVNNQTWLLTHSLNQSINHSFNHIVRKYGIPNDDVVVTLPGPPFNHISKGKASALLGASNDQ